jgi:hypothetical protein
MQGPFAATSELCGQYTVRMQGLSCAGQQGKQQTDKQRMDKQAANH